MKKSFPGFPKDLFKFLRELSKNNNRVWFNENKTRYLSNVVDPVSEFIMAIAPRLKNISDCYIADPRPHGGSMFRIYRDARFSKDKTPYKENVGCHFRHMAGKDAHAPGFYVHMQSKKVFFGGGVWRPPNPVLDNIRVAIVENPQQWGKIIKNKTFLKRMGGINGDKLKRPPRGYQADHAFIEDLKRKSFFAMQMAGEDLALTPKFITEVERAFTTISPMIQFITDAMDLPYSKR